MILLEKGGGYGKMEGGRCLEMGVLPHYNKVFLEIPHDAALEKNLNVFIFPLLTNTCYKIVA